MTTFVCKRPCINSYIIRSCKVAKLFNKNNVYVYLYKLVP